MTDLEFVKAVRGLIDTPEKWCQGEYERKHGQQHCLLGAAMLFNDAPMNVEEYFATLLGFKADFEVTTWNDDHERTHAEVIAKLDETIARLEAA